MFFKAPVAPTAPAAAPAAPIDRVKETPDALPPQATPFVTDAPSRQPPLSPCRNDARPVRSGERPDRHPGAEYAVFPARRPDLPGTAEKLTAHNGSPLSAMSRLVEPLMRTGGDRLERTGLVPAPAASGMTACRHLEF
ncbi:MAG: hypothetical protein LBT40_04840 [Deltaproteobacteria bacterium]|nr:hypothetical protein [Deltaproteobacteria bacterium]